MNREGFFFFVILIFLIFFYFLKRVISTQTQKISDCKINVLKVERVQNTFKNLNSSEMTLKILKIMQIYQNVFFWGFRYFFVIFYFF
jgi:hypothetical protein